MKKMLLSELARESGGYLEGVDQSIASTSTDSRTATAGDVYFCLCGETFDGHDFALDALSKGVIAIVAQTPIDTTKFGASVSVLIVPDARKAYGLFARFWRRERAPILVGLTGSNGKTTVKQMLTAIFSQAQGCVHSTRENDNNDIGVPQTLLGIQSGHQYAVVEMGANRRGEIAWLGKITEPDIALVTNVSAAHLEGFGTIDDVAKEKSAIYEALPERGIAIINLDDSYADTWLAMNRGREIITFGTRADAQVQVSSLSGNGMRICNGEECTRCELSLIGKHNHMNAAAAAAVAVAAGVSLQQVVDGLAKTQPVKGRLNYHALGIGITVIDDTYNANPASTCAAIDVLAATPGNRYLVLADLRELGGDADLEHRQVGEYAASCGVDKFYATGVLMRSAVESFGVGGRWFESKQSLQLALEADLNRNSDRANTVLIKGSRSMQMESVVSCLLTKYSERSAEGSAVI